MEAKRLLWVGAGALGLLALAALGAISVAAATAPLDKAPPANPANLAGAQPATTPVACTVSYTYTVSSGTFLTATDLLPGSQCGRCVVSLTLPFPITFYGQTYSSANVNTDGNVQFASADLSLASCPGPYSQLGPALLPYWCSCVDTSWSQPCQGIYGQPCGVFTRITGTAPARTFTLEWRARFNGSNHETVDYAVRLHEDSAIIDFVYGGGIMFGYSTAVGVQNGSAAFTPYLCNVSHAFQYTQIQWIPQYPPACQPNS